MSEIEELKAQIERLESAKAASAATYDAQLIPLRQQLLDAKAKKFSLSIGDELRITLEFQDIVAGNNGDFILAFYPFGRTVYLLSILDDLLCFISEDPPGQSGGVIGNIPLAVIQEMRRDWLEQNS